MPRVLVVDDEPGVRESLRMLLKGDCEVAAAADVEAALREIDLAPPDLVLLDLIMPGRSGLDLLAELKERGAAPPVVVLTATKTLTTAVEAMKRGAADYVTKPFELDALRIKVRQLLERADLERELARLRDQIAGRQRLGELLGRSPAMQAVFRAIERVAGSRATVLVTGESGTGKELVARALHTLGPRSKAPFVAVNCGAIPRELIESELFGHERGAFTDASERRVGRFEAASGGTLLLDEIGELEPALQVKLLRALQERTIERVGSSQSLPIDVRVVAATHRDLEREVAEGRFRADLFYRINVVPIRLPPLRARREDIALLAEHYLAGLPEDEGPRPTLSAEALHALEHYSWPGNVRELENALEHGRAMCDGAAIDHEHLPETLRLGSESEVLRERWRSGALGFEDAVAKFEAQLIAESLGRHDGNQTRAAADLGITRRVLKLKMDRFGID